MSRFKSANVPQSVNGLMTLPIEQELRKVAEAFVEAQQARHAADYDLGGPPLTRAYALQQINAVEQAFSAWKAVMTKPNAKVFLVALLLHDALKSR